MIVCSLPCSIARMDQLQEMRERDHLKEIRRKNKALKDKIKTYSEWQKDLQKLVNKFVSLRDKGKPCISCDKPDTGVKRDAGHFWSQGGNPSVRFDLDNIHGQCVHCNRDKHGNLLEYRPRLIERIGRERFDELEQRRNTPLKLQLSEIKDQIELFKQMIKDEQI